MALLSDKPIKQGGVFNFLGQQPEVTAPKFWQSSENSPPTELAYITEAEKDLLLNADLHGSLKGSPNIGASGILSFDGWGSEDPGQNVAGADISAGMDTDPGHSGWSDGRGSSTGGGSQFHGTATPDLPPGVTDVGNNPIGEDIDEAYTDTSFNVNATNTKTLADKIIDYIKGGGIIGMAIRGISGLLGKNENQYEGITGEDGIGEGDFVYSSPNEYAQGEFGLNYKDLDLEQQAEIDQKFYDSGHRSEAFQELYRDGDTSNIDNLTNQEKEAVSSLIPQASYIVANQTPEPSMVDQWFANNQAGTGLDPNYLNTYNTAKAQIANTMGMVDTSNQFGYSATPYGGLTAQNLNTNPFNTLYMRQLGLI